MSENLTLNEQDDEVEAPQFARIKKKKHNKTAHIIAFIFDNLRI